MGPGVVALVEYERDPTTGTLFFPQAMSEDRVREIDAFFGGSNNI